MESVDRQARERIVKLLVVEVFLLFFQGFMIAPLLPRLAIAFGSDVGSVSAVLPAYTLPYGIVCLAIGPIADRIGRARALQILLVIAIGMPLATATATSLPVLIAWRIAAGIGLGGIAPIGLALIAEMFPYAERGRPVGWIFGAIAGGMALGAAGGPILESWLGWRGVFVVVAVASALAAIVAWPTLRARRRIEPARVGLSPRALVVGYLRLLGQRRGAIAYGLVLVNAVFHGGVFAWLGVYFVDRFALDPSHLGFALAGYGVPGIVLGPILGRLADRIGRRGLIHAGLILGATAALVLAAPIPALAATAAVVGLSIGLDMSHPLLSGIVSTLDAERPAQAMALNTFMVFGGFGIGSIVFGALYLHAGMVPALISFAVIELMAAAFTFAVFDRTWR